MAQAFNNKLGVSDDPVAVRVSLRDCLEAALDQSDGLMDRVLDGLVGRGDKAFGMHVKPSFPPPVQAVAEILSANRNQLKRSFMQCLRTSVYQGAGMTAPSAQLMRFEDLKLFEDGDLDESIEVARALQEISQVTDDALPTLNALMSSMLGWITVQPDINPLRPDMYARALREAIAEQVGDVDIRTAILSPTAGRLGIVLRKLYTEINAWLKSAGIEEASAVAPSHVLQSNVAKTTTVGSSVARTLLTLDRLRKLLAGELEGEAVRRPQDFLHTVPASLVALQDMNQVEAMVQRLETKARKADENPQADAARKKAAARLALADNKNLGKQLGEEVVRLMLDNLIQDDRLLPRVRDHLQALEPLLMDIAQTDIRFFSDKQHTARQFLDKIINRSLAFANERAAGYEAFVKSLDKCISDIERKVQRGEPANTALSAVMLKLEAVWQREDAIERAHREEAALALQHAEQRNMLAQYLAQEFRANAEGIEVPFPVVDFVCGPWAQAVAESQLRCTDGSSDPQGYHELVSELYWSVQPRVARRNRNRLVQMIPAMLSKLRQGLQLIEFPPEKITDFFTQLIGMHEAALEGGRPKATAMDAGVEGIESTGAMPVSQSDRAELEALYAASRDTTNGQAVDSVPSELTTQTHTVEADESPESASTGVWLGKQEAADAGFLEEAAVQPAENTTRNTQSPTTDTGATVAAQSIPIGSWVEIFRSDQWVRCRLSWASPHRTLYMFVEHGGKMHSMSQRTIDKLRSQNLIRMVSDGKLVEKALDAVAQTALRNSLDASRTSG
ncbi:MAG: DUF1631 family protein [Burkholderiaceae bacterium]